MVSPEKQSHIKKTVAYHMGELRRGFESGDLNEELLCNMDETHFVINCDNVRTLGFRGDTEVKIRRCCVGWYRDDHDGLHHGRFACAKFWCTHDDLPESKPIVRYK